MDNFSSIIIAIAIRCKIHEEVMEAFTDNWVHRIGAPEFLVSDNKFVSQAVQKMYQAFNITHIPTPMYNLTNTQIKRQFRTIK